MQTAGQLCVFFQGSAAEVEVITEEYAPPMYTKNEFKLLVNEASGQRHTFLTINNKIGSNKRFRRNLDEFITLSKLGMWWWWWWWW